MSHLRAVESTPPTLAELVAERFRAIDEFVARYGMDYWDHHDTAPGESPGTQLDLDKSEAA